MEEIFIIEHPRVTVTLKPISKKEDDYYDYEILTKYKPRTTASSQAFPNIENLIKEYFKKKYKSHHTMRLDICNSGMKWYLKLYFDNLNYVPVPNKSNSHYDDPESCRKYLGGWLDASDASLACGFASDCDMF